MAGRIEMHMGKAVKPICVVSTERPLQAVAAQSRRELGLELQKHAGRRLAYDNHITSLKARAHLHSAACRLDTVVPASILCMVARVCDFPRQPVRICTDNYRKGTPF